MKFWAFLMGAFFWYVLASSGYPSFGMVTMVFCSLYALLPEPKASEKEKKADYEQLEPIVIESKRGAPYRIPEKIELKYKEKDKTEKDWADNAVSGLAGAVMSGVSKVKGLMEK